MKRFNGTETGFCTTEKVKEIPTSLNIYINTQNEVTLQWKKIPTQLHVKKVVNPTTIGAHL